MGVTWGALGLVWGRLGCSEATMGPTGVLWGTYGDQLGYPLGVDWGMTGVLLGRIAGSPLGVYWGALRAIGSALRCSWAFWNTESISSECSTLASKFSSAHELWQACLENALIQIALPVPMLRQVYKMAL